jgi:hypothetical protein
MQGTNNIKILYNKSSDAFSTQVRLNGPRDVEKPFAQVSALNSLVVWLAVERVLSTQVDISMLISIES